MNVVLGFLPQLYPTTTSITVPYALNLGMPAQVHIYISEVVNNYIGMQGGYDMPTFIVPVNGAWGTIVNFRSKNDYSQYVVPMHCSACQLEGRCFALWQLCIVHTTMVFLANEKS